MPAWDLDGLARVAAALDTPIASGETEYTRYGFRRMLELRSADMLMPDLQRVGGVSEFMRVGHMAESYDIPVSSHLFPETSLQVLGALSNTIYLEYMPWFSKLYNEAIEFEDGRRVVPERPGWGFTFNQDYVSHLETGMSASTGATATKTVFREEAMKTTRREFTIGTAAAAAAAALAVAAAGHRAKRADPHRLARRPDRPELGAGDRLQPRRPVCDRGHQRGRRRQGPQDRDSSRAIRRAIRPRR